MIKNGAITSLKPVQALYFCVYVSVGHRHHALLCLETVGHDAVEVAEEAVKRPRIVRGCSFCTAVRDPPAAVLPTNGTKVPVVQNVRTKVG